MNETDARRLWLTRAFESPLTPPWTQADAVWATDEARRQLGSQATLSEWASRRARVALQRLGGRSVALKAAIEQAVAPTSRGGWWIVTAGAAAFVLGLLADALGNRGRIDLLSLPLIGLLGWNLLVYASLVTWPLLRGRLAQGRQSRGLRSMAMAALQWAMQERQGPGSASGQPAPQTGDTAPAWQAALSRFGPDWARINQPVWQARAAAALHLAAAGLAAGAFAGLYLRGLALEYRASWDSTFLTASQALHLLQALLGPASQITGVPLPTATAFEALRGSSGGSENAARWIHLWSATLGLAIVLPRLGLALGSLAKAGRAARNPALPWTEDPWLIHLTAQHRTGPVRLVVIPYRTQPDDTARAQLRETLTRSLGSEPAIAWSRPVAEADECAVGETARIDDASVAPVVLMSARQTPERETHGRFLRDLQVSLDGRGAVPLLLVDECGFGSRLSQADAATRLRERRSAWQHLAGELGLEALFVDLGAAPGTPPRDASIHEAIARRLMASPMPQA